MEGARPSGTAGNHRNLKDILKKGKVDGDSLFFGLVTEIDTEHDGKTVISDAIQPGNLGEKVESTLQTGGITDGYNDIGLAGSEKIAGNLFFLRMGTEGIGAREINQKEVSPAVLKNALSGGHCLARPISGVLP